jgi:CheY-like chemotaxis protein
MKNISIIDTALNGKIALDLVLKNSSKEKDENNIIKNYYEAIFLDLDMPILNGYEACKKI